LQAVIEAGELGGEVQTFVSPDAAMRAAIGRAGESDRILAFGSFYTVAGVREALQSRR
jgi:dihydrofolate synthase/folylpolyglutamate synthase